MDEHRRESRIEEILTGPPTKDELAAAAATCTRLKVHLERKAPYDGYGAKNDINALRAAIWILKAFLLVFIITGCSNETDKLIDADTEVVERDSALIELDDQLVEHDAGLIELDAGLIELDARVVEHDTNDISSDAAIVDLDCIYAGTWSVKIAQSILCISPDEVIILHIANCRTRDFSRSLELSNPYVGEFSGGITFHVEFEDQNSFVGTADLIGTVLIHGDERECSTTATILGRRYETITDR